MQDPLTSQQLTRFANLINSHADNRARPHEVEPDIELDTYVQELDYHGITLLALNNGTLPVELTQKLASRKAMMAANNVIQTTALIELFEAFDTAGLNNNILFKGSALAYDIYPQPWLRPRSDNDCLIDHADYPQYERILEQLGFKKEFAVQGKYVSYQHSFSKPLVGKTAMNLDLHWRINNRQILAGCYSVHELVNDSQTLSALPATIKVPCAVDSLLIASLHRLGHHQHEERLAWLYDIHLLASRLTTIQWQQLCRKAADKKLAAITLDALIYCKTLFDTRLPDSIEGTLSDLAALNEPSQVFLKRELAQWKLFFYDLRGLDGWSNKLWLIFENFFPSPAYVRRQMETNNTFMAYLRRILRGIRRITR